ncbi:MAG TPA: sigma-70 family RNA polymerase sigma factor [Novosphingobium sp.]
MSDIRRQIVSLLPRLRRMAWSIARDASDCDDLLQRTVERALARADGWQDGTRLDLWMLRIMKNIWIDEIRARKRWGRVIEPGLPDEEPGDGGAAAEDLLDAAELSRLRSLVESLPEEQRLAIKLVLLGGCSYTEAAAILEIPEGTLTSRLARGRAALLRHYQSGETRH